jgi:hypothetical protein
LHKATIFIRPSPDAAISSRAVERARRLASAIARVLSGRRSRDWNSPGQLGFPAMGEIPRLLIIEKDLSFPLR